MGTFKLSTFASDDALAQTLASRLRDILNQWPIEKPFSIALSGGRVARPFYQAIQKSGGLPKLEVHFFWADERCVPPADPDSNFALANEYLFAPLQVPPDRIHRIRAEMPEDYAVAEAQAEICRIVPLTPDGQPILNLILLGMGEDGHVASLFPGEPEKLIDSREVYRAVVGQKRPFRRITIGYPAILAAERVWAAVSGPAKEVPLAEALSGQARNPLGRVIQRRNETEILTTTSSEKLLNRTTQTQSNR